MATITLSKLLTRFSKWDILKELEANKQTNNGETIMNFGEKIKNDSTLGNYVIELMQSLNLSEMTINWRRINEYRQGVKYSLSSSLDLGIYLIDHRNFKLPDGSNTLENEKIKKINERLKNLYSSEIKGLYGSVKFTIEDRGSGMLLYKKKL